MMTTGEIIGATIFALSALCGGVWWLAVLHATVKVTEKSVLSIERSLSTIAEELRAVNSESRDHANLCDRDRLLILQRLDALEGG